MLRVEIAGTLDIVIVLFLINPVASDEQVGSVLCDFSCVMSCLKLTWRLGHRDKESPKVVTIHKRSHARQITYDTPQYTFSN